MWSSPRCRLHGSFGSVGRGAAAPCLSRVNNNLVSLSREPIIIRIARSRAIREFGMTLGLHNKQVSPRRRRRAHIII